MEKLSDRLEVVLFVGSSWVNSGSSVLTSVSMRTLTDMLWVGLVLDHIRVSMLLDRRGAKLVLRMHTADLFLVSDLGYTLDNRSHIDICNLYSLVVINFQSFIDNLWWSLDCQRLLWTFTGRLVHHWHLLLAFKVFIFLKVVQVILSSLELVLADWVVVVKALLHLIHLNRWKELPLSQQSVDLSHKLKGGVILIED